MRGINERFIKDLKTGCLEFFLNQAKNNSSICLEIRDNYINLYYRGGNAIKISQRSKGYSFQFNSRYCKNKGNEANFEHLNSLDCKDLEGYIESFPIILSEMDSWFKHHPKNEREFQHNLIKRNQRQIIILDVEYAGWTSAKRLFKLDMIGADKIKEGYIIIIFENKYGDHAISGSAGIQKHYMDIVDILSNSSTKKNLIGSIVNIANNKTDLGLTELLLTEEDIKDIEVLFLIAGFNMKSKSIANEVSSIQKSMPAKICFINPSETTLDYSMAKDLFENEV